MMAIEPEVESRNGVWVDYSHELELTRNPLLRLLFMVLGLLSLGSAILGIILPGWPTTIWLIFATFFFVRSSPRFYNRLMNHRIFGPLIRDFRAGLGIPLRAKLLAIAMIVLFAGSSALFLIDSLWLSGLVAVLGAAGVTYLSWLPTRPARA